MACKRRMISILGLMLLISTAACESKFAEPAPDQVETKGIPLDERVQQKSEIDRKISEIQSGAEKIKKMISLFLNIQDPGSSSQAYTPLDFLIDAAQELKTKIPENKGIHLVRYGRVQLPSSLVAENCRSLDISLESDPNQVSSMALSVKSCTTDGKFLQAVNITWQDSNMHYQVNNETLGTTFGSLLSEKALLGPNCDLTTNQDVVEGIACHDLQIQLSKIEVAKVKTISLSSVGETRFESHADIFKTDIQTAISDISVSSNGAVKFNLQKVDSQTNSPVAQATEK